MKGTITVIHFRDSQWNRQTRMFADPGCVYIGRYMARFNLPNSILHNPYKLDPKNDTTESRRLVLNRYEIYAKDSAPVMSAIADLRRRVDNGEQIKLVCWCKGTQGEGVDVLCHGDVIQRLVMQYATKTETRQEKLF